MAYLDYNGLQRFKTNLDAQTNGLIASVYDSTKTYDVGDYVIYNNDLYRCTTAITTAEAWTAAHWTQVALSDDVSDLQSALETKAEIDGYYEGMTVGNAEQLVSTVGVSDSAPYTFRTTGGSADVGDRMNLKAVVGGTVAWNQFSKELNSTNWTAESGVTASYTDGVATISSTKANNGIKCNTGVAPVAGHKYYLAFSAKSDSPVTLKFGYASASGVFGLANTTSSFVRYENIKNCTTATLYGQIFFLSATTYSNVQVKDAILVDLTAMFGSAIADYAYTLESGTAGAGIAWLKKYGWFTKLYYPYAVANLQSVKTSAHKTYGFNAYNPSTGKAKVVGGMVYQITGAYTALSLDGTSITPDASGYFTPSANGELTVTGGNGTTTCIHLKWDGERDGEWEEFSEHTYALDDVELRGMLRLDANNNIYADGDIYPPSGEAQRRYEIVDLGTLNWQKMSGKNNLFNTRLPLSTAAYGGSSDAVCNAVCAKYVAASITNTYSSEIDKTVSFTSTGYCYIEDSAYSDAATFKTSLSGVYLVYKLETPTTEAASPYQQTQIVDDFGTEEFVDAATRDFDMPVGHNTVYQPNLRAKVEMAPNSPDGDGDYLVRQTNGVNEYVLFSEVKELPDYPTTDGTFVLQVTVSDGAASYSWVAKE